MGDVGRKRAAAPFVHRLRILPVVERHGAQLAACHGAAAPRMGDDLHRRIFADIVRAALHESRDVLRREQPPIDGIPKPTKAGSLWVGKVMLPVLPKPFL